MRWVEPFKLKVGKLAMFIDSDRSIIADVDLSESVANRCLRSSTLLFFSTVLSVCSLMELGWDGLGGLVSEGGSVDGGRLSKASS
ncbi:hypothetical protein OE88DRAFT_395499 [Heliocybe sulcata]|uniref:Uncharacterized protein n=1 Tax=Heliocybe sulcata TaxID=5364 RepID=A0A5C3MUN9_9AGAM|nr:hypothetical protein OE88DRAFT_395499 [Heliocybe sulcata]